MYINKYFNINNCILLLSIPYFIVVLLLKYEPSWDETFQIEAAIRLAKVGIYDSSWKLPIVWGENNYNYLNAWPPGYSLFLSVFIFSGIKPMFISKLLRITFIILSYYIWKKNANKILKDYFLIFIYKLILITFLIISSNYNTELLLLILLGYIWRYIYNFSFIHDHFKFYFLLGFITSLLFLFKYTGLGFIVAIAFLLFLQMSKQKINSFFLKYSFFVLPIIIIISIIFYLNHKYTNDIITMSYLPSINNIRNINRISYFSFIHTVFFNSLQIPLIISKLLYYKWKIAGDIFIFIYYLFIVSIIVFYFYTNRNRSNIKVRKFIFLTLILFLIFSLFMFIYTLFFFTDLNSWYPLNEYRYYLPIAPLLFILFLFFSKSIINKFKFLILPFIILLFIIVNLYTIKKYKNSIYANNEIHKVNNFIKSLNTKTNSNSVMIFTDLTLFTLIDRYHNVNIYQFPSVFAQKQTYYQKKNTIVVLISSKFNYQDFNGKNSEKNFNILFFAKNNNFEHFKLSNKTDIFWKHTTDFKYLHTKYKTL
jgi:hypothetical protein